jgi:hypothetical protein
LKNKIRVVLNFFSIWFFNTLAGYSIKLKKHKNFNVWYKNVLRKIPNCEQIQKRKLKKMLYTNHPCSCRLRRIFWVDRPDTDCDGSCLLDIHRGLYSCKRIVCCGEWSVWKNQRIFFLNKTKFMLQLSNFDDNIFFLLLLITMQHGWKCWFKYTKNKAH